jgi:unspecific monooxygenase
VEELMRYDTPLQLFERWVLDDIEIDGTTIPRGAEIAMLFGSANHDPDVFDAPDRLDLTRRDNPHISFSAGIHYCIGAPLARIELAASLRALLTQAPTLTLAAEPERKPNFVIRGLKGLRVEVG